MTGADAAPRGRGRPAIGGRVEVRLPTDELERVDALAGEHGVTRAVMLRRMIELAANEADRRGWDVLR